MESITKSSYVSSSVVKLDVKLSNA